MTRNIEKNAQFTIRLPQSLKDQLQESAKQQDIDGVTWIRHAIKEKLEREVEPTSDCKKPIMHPIRLEVDELPEVMPDSLQYYKTSDIKKCVREVIEDYLRERKKCDIPRKDRLSRRVKFHYSD